VDEELELTSYYLDADQDGYGDSSLLVESCALEEGYSVEGGDCDDGNPSIYPSAPEPDCTDPTDYNCDGTTSYLDVDQDGVAACGLR
jgi:hypothetical protein